MSLRPNRIILHLAYPEKFLLPFFKLLQRHFPPQEHVFAFYWCRAGALDDYGNSQVFSISRPGDWLKLFLLLQKSAKIILHGLWNEKLIKFVLLQPWLHRKIYWVMWGGDFYFPQEQSSAKKVLIRRIGHFITYIGGDFEYLSGNYGARGRYHHCLMYPSNTFREQAPAPGRRDPTLNLLVGNSATASNRHLQVFERLKQLAAGNFRIFCPLSYGDAGYARHVADEGKRLFGKRFVPLLKLLPFESYLGFLNKIDIGFFIHNRQQGMGNIIQLLGQGKKVFLSRETTQFRFLEQSGIRVFDFDGADPPSLLDPVFPERERNRSLIRNLFSEERLVTQWKEIFDD